MSSSSNTIAAAASYKKIGGTLSFDLSTSTLIWSPSSTSVSISSFSILAKSQIQGLSVSIAGSPNVSLLVLLKENHSVQGIDSSKGRVLLTFTAPTIQAEEQRENFKLKLASAIKSGQPKIVPPSITSTSTSNPPSNPTMPPPRSNPIDKTPRNIDGTPLTEFDYRIKVFHSNPSILALHREVVASGEMSDSDFWSHPSRSSLVRAEKALAMQKAGRNAKIADPKAKADSNGMMTMNITPEIIRDMFEQFPVVGKAYDENVPKNMDESSFWTRYFESKLYHRLRTSARSAASEHMVASDEIFDKYLEDEDDELEPRRHVNAHDALLDLGSTAEDHQETGNSRDWTMRAGVERRTLPLMRRFNDHSQSLLDSALGAQEDIDEGDGTSGEVGGSSRMKRSRRIVGGVGEEYGNSNGNEDEEEDLENAERRKQKGKYYNSIVIDDLEEEDLRRNVPLDVRENKGYFQGTRNNRSKGGEEIENKTDSEIKSLLLEVRNSLDDPVWQNDDLGNFTVFSGGRSLGPNGGSMAMSRMLGNIRDKLQAKSGGKTNANLLDTTQKALISNQTTTTEFLRQYWSFVAPQPDPSFNPDEGRTLSGNRLVPPIALSVEQRRVKAQGMKDRLSRTDERVRDLIRKAEERGEEDAEVKILSALAPTQQAVRRALGQ